MTVSPELPSEEARKYLRLLHAKFASTRVTTLLATWLKLLASLEAKNLSGRQASQEAILVDSHPFYSKLIGLRLASEERTDFIDGVISVAQGALFGHTLWCLAECMSQGRF